MSALGLGTPQIVGLLFGLIFSGANARAEDVICQNGPQAGWTVPYLPASRAMLSSYYFTQPGECKRAIASAASGYICVPGSEEGTEVPFSLKQGKPVGEFYFVEDADCEKAVRGMKDDLICTEGPDSEETGSLTYGVYDVREGRFAERYYHSTMAGCLSAIQSPQIEISRNERIPDGAVQHCDDVRLDSPGGSMEHVEVRSQGQLPICFGEVAAQANDAWRFTHGDVRYQFQTSGIAAALQSHIESPDWELDEGGLPSDALAAIGRYGACDQAVTIESQDDSTILQLIEELKHVRSERIKAGARYRLGEDDVEWFKTLYAGPSCLATQGLPDLAKLFQDLTTLNVHVMLSGVLGGACERSNLIKTRTPTLVTTLWPERKTPLEIANYLSSRISRPGDLPIEVDICASVLIDNVKYREMYSRALSVSSCPKERHGTLLIGKRKNSETGRCEFLVRNSWGMDCSVAGRNWPCDHGSLWMDADSLTRALVRVAELRPPAN